jgi:hypothetical protein
VNLGMGAGADSDRGMERWGHTTVGVRWRRVLSETAQKKDWKGKEKGNHVWLLRSRLSLSAGDVAHELY